MASVQELERRLNELESQIAPQSAHAIIDSRLSEKQKRHMQHMMTHLGINEAEAKIRVLCMGVPPDHFEQLPAGGAYPKMLYHANGKFAMVENEEQHKTMKKDGWQGKPLPVHLKKLQMPNVARDEQIKRLKKELESEIAGKAEESVSASA